MFRKVTEAMARRQAETEVEHGLSLVRRHWLEYRSQHDRLPDESLVQYVAPFIAPMMERLASDPVWREIEPPLMLDLIFTVLRAEVGTEHGLAQLEAMREALLPGK